MATAAVIVPETVTDKTQEAIIEETTDPVSTEVQNGDVTTDVAEKVTTDIKDKMQYRLYVYPLIPNDLHMDQMKRAMSGAECVNCHFIGLKNSKKRGQAEFLFKTQEQADKAEENIKNIKFPNRPELTVSNGRHYQDLSFERIMNNWVDESPNEKSKESIFVRGETKGSLNKITVSNLPLETPKSLLRRLFPVATDIEMQPLDEGKETREAVLTFVDKSEVEKSIKNATGVKLQDKPIHIQRVPSVAAKSDEAQEKEEEEEGSRKRKLEDDTTESETEKKQLLSETSEETKDDVDMEQTK